MAYGLFGPLLGLGINFGSIIFIRNYVGVELSRCFGLLLGIITVLA